MQNTEENNSKEIKYYQPSFGEMNPAFDLVEDTESAFFDLIGNQEFEYKEEVVDAEIEMPI